MGAPGQVIWDVPQGLYDGEGMRRKTVYDGVSSSSAAPAAPAAPAATSAAANAAANAAAQANKAGEADTDETVRRLLRDLAVS